MADLDIQVGEHQEQFLVSFLGNVQTEGHSADVFEKQQDHVAENVANFEAMVGKDQGRIGPLPTAEVPIGRQQVQGFEWLWQLVSIQKRHEDRVGTGLSTAGISEIVGAFVRCLPLPRVAKDDLASIRLVSRNSQGYGTRIFGDVAQSVRATAS